MKRVKSLVFNTFLLDNDGYQPADLIELFKAERYSDEKGIGLTNVSGDASLIQGTMLKRTLTNIQEFDPIEQNLVKKQIPVFNSVSFSINLNMNLLTVFGGQSQLNLIRTMLRDILGFKYSVEPIALTPIEFSKTLEKKHIDSRIHQLTIRRFNFENGMVGRFSGDITKQSVAKELLDIYGSAVVKVVFVVTLEQDELLVQILPNGNVKWLCEEEDFEYYLEYFKQIIFS